MLCTIIGAGPELGAALGRRFGKGGYRVAIVTRNRKAVEENLTTSLERIGIETRGFLADGSLPTDLDKAFDEIKAWGGRTDALIYNVAAMHSTNAVRPHTRSGSSRDGDKLWGSHTQRE